MRMRKSGGGGSAGDVSPAEFEREVYRELRKSCSAGQRALDEKWSIFLSPMTVLLFQAAIYVCAGDRDRGRQLFLEAAAVGFRGVRSVETACNVYKAVRSVLEQVDPRKVNCPEGSQSELPPWPDVDPPPDGAPRDDPRTPQDESTATTTSSATSVPSNTNLGG